MKVYGADGVQYLADITECGLNLSRSIHSWFQACVTVKRLSGDCRIMDVINCCPLLLTPYCSKRALGKACEP